MRGGQAKEAEEGERERERERERKRSCNEKRQRQSKTHKRRARETHTKAGERARVCEREREGERARAALVEKKERRRAEAHAAVPCASAACEDHSLRLIKGGKERAGENRRQCRQHRGTSAVARNRERAEEEEKKRGEEGERRGWTAREGRAVSRARRGNWAHLELCLLCGLHPATGDGGGRSKQGRIRAG